MKSNTDKPQMTTPSNESFEEYRELFTKEKKKVLVPIAVLLVVVFTTFLFLNIASAGFGYQSSISKTGGAQNCLHPYPGVRRYILPGYIAGCWFGSR